jgi:FO synthase
MHAVSRLVLHPHITNIQTSWVKMGPEGAKQCLAAGANDLGGTLMNESISRAAGTEHGQEFPPAAMTALIESMGRVPAQRTTAYGDVAEERQAASWKAAPLTEVRLDPPVFKRKQRAARLNAVDQQSSEQKKNTQGIPSA